LSHFGSTHFHNDPAQIAMLKNYFKVALRNLLRNKTFSLINIIGLVGGMSTAVLILLWIHDEVSFDKFHANKDQLYEVWSRGEYDQQLQCWNSTPRILGPTLLKDYAGIANMTRTDSRWFVTAAGETRISSKALIADTSFLSMFSFPVISGNKTGVLNDKHSIMITEKMAKKMFGGKEALQQTISIDNYNFTVAGILKDLPSNSRFDFEFLLPWNYAGSNGYGEQNWENNSTNTFVQLNANASAEIINGQIRDIAKRHLNKKEADEVFLHPLSKWHLYSRFENGGIAGGRIDEVKMFGIIAGFILLIACINFMNLSTARSEKRAKEVGIRKVTGAGKTSLVLQFIGESIIVAAIAGVLSMMLVHTILPAFSRLVNKPLAVPYHSPGFWLAAVSFIVITGAIAGSYPAFFLSSFKPVTVLKGSFKKTQEWINPRKVLVVFQFGISIILIICTIVVALQIRHAEKRNTGFQSNALLYHWNTGDLNKNFLAVKNDLLHEGLAESVTRTSSQLTEQFSSTTGLEWQHKMPGENSDIERIAQDENLVRTAGLELIAGRDMDLTAFPSDSTAMLINESAMKVMDFKQPLGQIIKDGDMAYHVVGVFRDYVFDSPYEKTKPMVILGAKGIGFNVIHIRMKRVSETQRSISSIEAIFKKYNPDYPFEYHFVENDHTLKFNEGKRVSSLTALFAGLTIFISCLGLFGLAAFMAEARIKEIGVRKVLGASVLRLTTLLSKDFILLVGIAFLLATPVSWLVMSKWLSSYSYRISIEWWMFALAGSLSVLIALLTVIFQTSKAALANPVKSLRQQ
jgi:putative ABC transport system permease protein